MKTSAMHGESGYERIANDAYWTPAWCTEALLDRTAFRPVVWEPACGRGDMVRALESRGHTVIASDIKIYDPQGGSFEMDFLSVNPIVDPVGFGAIITNPPYAQAEAFIRKALELATVGNRRVRVAMLLRNEYDSAAGRRYLFEHPAFLKKLVLTKRPRWSADNKASPRHNFAWYVWCWNKPPDAPPVMEWGP